VSGTSTARSNAPRPPIAQDVLEGLSAPQKRLPPYLFYDAQGSELFERITELPEYYLTRTERSILEARADEIVRAAARGASGPLHLVELGAGTATKSEILLSAAVRMQGPTIFVPVDVSHAALDEARARIAARQPRVAVRPLVARHEDALGPIRELGARRLVLFIGSSIGNHEDAEAVALLAGVRGTLAPGGALLLGADLRKSADVLVPAYDDAQGVTAAFNKNVLARINRELGGHFDLDRFRHVALWNDEASCMEIYLESSVAQTVAIDLLELDVRFEAGERIHTESSIKYDDRRIDRILEASGFARELTFTDDERRFALVLARTR